MSFRVLVVDDSPFIRRILTDWLKGESEFELIGTASNGQEAVDLASTLKPDVITMDIEMPIRDGLSALEEIMKSSPCPVLMVSSLTQEGADATLRALTLGAVDFVPKPNGSSSLAFIGAKEEFLEKLRACVSANLKAVHRKPVLARAPKSGGSDRVICIASSTGGPKALATLWQSLPEGFPAAILIAQHMPSGFTQSLAKRLTAVGSVPCREAQNGDYVRPGAAYIAPGGYHMVVSSGGLIELNQEAPIHGVRPAADHLFQSAAAVYGSKLLGIVLTGMGRDGAAGAKAVRDAGGLVYGEDESTCAIYGMPRAAKELGGINAEFPIHELGAAVVAGLKDRVARAS